MIKLRPSGSHIWTKCAAAPLFQSRVPEQPATDSTREGTCAAWLAEMCLTGEVKNCAELLDHNHPDNNWLITSDMVDLVQQYCDILIARSGIVYAEIYVNLNAFIGGTLDAGAISNPDILYIDDLKFGYDIVEPFENPQLLIYAAGLILEKGYTHPNVSLGIYQPRAIHPSGSYRTWLLTSKEVIDRAKVIVEAGIACQSPSPTAVPGTHCKYCEARASCTALAHSVYSVYSVVESDSQLALTSLTIASELDFLDRAEKLISARLTGVRAEAEQIIKSGGFVKGWGMVSSTGRRKFNYPPNIISAITGLDSTKVVPMSPSEVENSAVNKAQMKRIIKLMATTASTKQRLSRINTRDIRRKFNI